MARLALAVVVILAVFPGQAMAQFGGPFAPPAEDYGPGITISGIGFAPRGERDRATVRAVADARARAHAVATALGVSLGEIRAVEVSTPFSTLRQCRPNERSRRCASLDAVSVEATFAIAGGPETDEGARELSGSGTALAPVEARRRTSPSIRRALLTARRAATPDAATAARATVEDAAAAAGIGLGPLFSVVESENPYGYQPLLGIYGPGRFCAVQRRIRIRPDPETGERRLVRGRPRLRCFRTRNQAVSLEVTYLGA